MTIYDELMEAAGTEFLPQAEGEPDAHYLRRLVLIVCSCSDEKWGTLSKAAQDWNNAQALRVKAHQDPEECHGFPPSLLSELQRTGTELKYPDYDSITKDVVTVNCPIPDTGTTMKRADRVTEKDANADQLVKSGFDKDDLLKELADRDKRVAHLAGLDNLPGAPVHVTVNGSTDGFSVSGTTLILDKPIVALIPDVEDQDSPHALSPKYTATDAVRALVMQHPDYNQSQIAAELEAYGRTVSLGTIATVRSMTLATIAVAKHLGKWVE